MKQLEDAETIWLYNQILLWEYRKSHIKEVKSVCEPFIDEMRKNLNKMREKELAEIEEIKKQIEKEKDEERKLADKQSLHDFNLKRRYNEFDYASTYLNDLTEQMSHMEIKEAKKIYQSLKSKVKEVFQWKKKNEIVYKKAPIKKCHKCGTSIVKDGGCNHMTCRNCMHQFCWICFKDWKTHGNNYFHCPFNEQDKQTPAANDLLNQNNNTDDHHNSDIDIDNDNNNSNHHNGNNNNDNYHNNNDNYHNENNSNNNDNDGNGQIPDFILIPQEHEDRNLFFDNDVDNDDNIEQEEIPENKEFTLPPMIGNRRSEFNRWEELNNLHERYLRSARRDKEQCSILSPYFTEALDAARLLLIHSYPLLFMLEPGSVTYHKLEYYVEELKKTYNRLISNCNDNSVEIADRLHKDINNLLLYADMINF